MIGSRKTAGRRLLKHCKPVVSQRCKLHSIVHCFYSSCTACPRAVVLTLSSYGGPAALAAEANAAFDAAESEVVAAYDAARVVANRRHMRSHAWEMQLT